MANKVGFNSLPRDIKLEIFSLFNPAIINKIARVCKQWKEICRDTSLWRRLYCRDFLFIHPSISLQNSISPELRNLSQVDLIDFAKYFAQEAMRIGFAAGMYNVNNFDRFTSTVENMNIIRKVALLQYKPMNEGSFSITNYYLYYKSKFLNIFEREFHNQVEVIGPDLVFLEYLGKCHKTSRLNGDARDGFIIECMGPLHIKSFFQNYVIWKSTQNNIKNFNFNRNVIPLMADKFYGCDKLIILFLWTIWLGMVVGFDYYVKQRI